MRVHPLLPLVALLGTGCMYTPGSLLRAPALSAYGMPFENSEVAQLDCLDVRVTHSSVPAYTLADPVLRIDFGNRCDHPVHVDFTALHARTRYANGAEFVLDPIDPRHEIHPALLDAREAASETLAFGDARVMRPPARVCLDVSRFNADAPTREPTEICVGGPDAELLVTPPADSVTPPWGPTS